MLCLAEWKRSSLFLRQFLRHQRRIRPELMLLCLQGLTTPMHLPSHATKSGWRTARPCMPRPKWILTVQWAAVRTARRLPAHAPRLRATVPTKDWMGSSSARGSAQNLSSGTLWQASSTPLGAGLHLVHRSERVHSWRQRSSVGRRQDFNLAAATRASVTISTPSHLARSSPVARPRPRTSLRLQSCWQTSCRLGGRRAQHLTRSRGRADQGAYERTRGRARDGNAVPPVLATPTLKSLCGTAAFSRRRVWLTCGGSPWASGHSTLRILTVGSQAPLLCYPVALRIVC